MQKIIDLIGKAYRGVTKSLNLLHSPLLLAIRLYWGWQFASDGLAKLQHLDHVTQFFLSLNIPAAGFAALMVALVELIGGILFALGIASRLTALILFVNMTMAYLSVPDDRAAFLHLVTAPDKFIAADPFAYWFAALLILILGPGIFAVDWLIARRFAPHSNPPKKQEAGA